MAIRPRPAAARADARARGPGGWRGDVTGVPLDDPRMPTLQGKYKVPHFDAKGEANAFFSELGVPTTFFCSEGHIRRDAKASCARNPAGSETLCMHGTTSRENREVPSSPVPMAAQDATGSRED